MANPDRCVNIIGRKSGKLEVISLNIEETLRADAAMWNCRCECGTETIVCSKNLTYDINGRGTKSCGCSWKEANERRKKQTLERKLKEKLEREKKRAT